MAEQLRALQADEGGAAGACSGQDASGSSPTVTQNERRLVDEAHQRRLCSIRTQVADIIVRRPVCFPRNDDCSVNEPFGLDLGRRLNAMRGRIEALQYEGGAALSHLEMQMINVSCDDPGASVGLQLVLPILQQRLDLEGLRRKAASAELLSLQLIDEEEKEKSATARKKGELEQQQQRQQQANKAAALAKGLPRGDIAADITTVRGPEASRGDERLVSNAHQGDGDRGAPPAPASCADSAGEDADGAACVTVGTSNDYHVLIIEEQSPPHATSASSSSAPMVSGGSGIASSVCSLGSSTGSLDHLEKEFRVPPGSGRKRGAKKPPSLVDSSSVLQGPTAAAAAAAAGPRQHQQPDRRAAMPPLPPATWPGHGASTRPQTPQAATAAAHTSGKGLTSAVAGRDPPPSGVGRAELRPGKSMSSDQLHLLGGGAHSPLPSLSPPPPPPPPPRRSSVQGSGTAASGTPPTPGGIGAAVLVAEPNMAIAAVHSSPPRPPQATQSGQEPRRASFESPWSMSLGLGDLGSIRRGSLDAETQRQKQQSTAPPSAGPSASGDGGASSSSFSFYSQYDPLGLRGTQAFASRSGPLQLSPDTSGVTTSSSGGLIQRPACRSPSGPIAPADPTCLLPALLSSLMDELGPDGSEAAAAPTDPQNKQQREAQSSHYAQPLPPPHFLCPLTQRVMRDPVVASDGYLYEREAVSAWLHSSGGGEGGGGGGLRSPVTGQAMQDARLVPVLPLRAAIGEWLIRGQEQRL